MLALKVPSHLERENLRNIQDQRIILAELQEDYGYSTIPMKRYHGVWWVSWSFLCTLQSWMQGSRMSIMMMEIQCQFSSCHSVFTGLMSICFIKELSCTWNHSSWMNCKLIPEAKESSVKSVLGKERKVGDD